MTLWRVRATVDDRPGFLAVLTASLALRSINILAVQVHTTETGAVDDFLVDAPDGLGEGELLAAIERGRGRHAWVTRTDAYDLVDPPTHMATLAARVTADPALLGQALSDLLGGCLVQHDPDSSITGQGSNVMRLGDPNSGGMIVLTRLAPSFTPAEFARAQGLVEVARSALARRVGVATLLLPDGAELNVRPGSSADLVALLEMHARCGEHSLYRRYFAGTRGPSRQQLGRLLRPARGSALVAEDAEGRLVALANLIGEGEMAEAALLVEDRWQRRGIGTGMLRRLIALAQPSGFRAVVLHTHADNEPMLRTVRRMPQTAALDVDGGVVSATLVVTELPAGAVR
jgi:ribosomal protein S18 acetylase RimI-like enzyme